VNSSGYTLMRATEAPDFSGDAPGAFLGYARPMGSEQLAFNLRVLEPGMTAGPPGTDPAWGHHHKTIEELYLVIEGELTMKLGDDELTLGPRDAVLIQPETMRAARNDTDKQAVLAMFSVKIPDIRAESVMADDFWT
jgi:mannose-6-phosphate isomerase-like protein (cupin superfamily)